MILNVGLAIVRVDADLPGLKTMLLIETAGFGIALKRLKGETFRRQCFRFVEQKRSYALVLESRSDKDLVQVAIVFSQDEKTDKVTGTFRYPYAGMCCYFLLKALFPLRVGPRMGKAGEIVMPRFIPELHYGFAILGRV